METLLLSGKSAILASENGKEFILIGVKRKEMK